ncbi:hypothetical protein [Sanguibacter suarezii]|uniref:hypothetical protein n=1 Tax=Sanguibacter suarezii TaxID=60921 RepID=UPI000831F4F6|nr:hypothetical protein [Sanguibacter suarezii]
MTLTWLQTLVITTVPAAVTAIALMVQSHLTSRSEDRRIAAARGHEQAHARAVLVRALHEDALRHLNLLVHDWGTRVRDLTIADRSGSSAPLISMDDPRRRVAETYDLSARLGLAASEESFAAFKAAVNTIGEHHASLLQTAYLSGTESREAHCHMDEALELRDAYRVAARKDCLFGT